MVGKTFYQKLIGASFSLNCSFLYIVRRKVRISDINKNYIIMV